jgi:hypothetical protein
MDHQVSLQKENFEVYKRLLICHIAFESDGLRSYVDRMVLSKKHIAI